MSTNTTTETPETSEERHGITAQPPLGCPLVEDAINEMDGVLMAIRNYNDCHDEGELHEMLREVEYAVSNYCCRGNANKLNAIRHRLEKVRAWGEDWKRYALELAKRP